jgi:RNA:NAD 2'-phosphotransferase (TPT1/KptA family)
MVIPLEVRFDHAPSAIVAIARKVGDEELKTLRNPHQCRQRKPRVKRGVLRGHIPYPDEVQETVKALKALNTSSHVSYCCDEQEPSASGDRRSATWDALLRRIQRQYMWRVGEEFEEKLRQRVEFDPIYPNIDVQEKFLNTLKVCDHSLLVTYHGTNAKNIDSISSRGLLVPGTGGVQVAHGSAHGIGIYTAKLGSASLSKIFRDSDTMFLCVVCDTSLPASDEDEFVPSTTQVQTKFPMRKVYGHHVVKQESDEVLHVGDAVVIYGDRYAIPVFAIRSQPISQESVLETHGRIPWERPQQIGRRRVIISEDSSGLVKFGIGAERQGKLVWLARSPLENASRFGKALRQRRDKRSWKLAHKQSTYWKRESYFRVPECD